MSGHARHQVGSNDQATCSTNEHASHDQGHPEIRLADQGPCHAEIQLAGHNERSFELQSTEPGLSHPGIQVNEFDPGHYWSPSGIQLPGHDASYTGAQIASRSPYSTQLQRPSHMRARPRMNIAGRGPDHTGIEYADHAVAYAALAFSEGVTRLNEAEGDASAHLFRRDLLTLASRC